MCYCTVYFSVGEFKTYPQKNSSTGTQTNVICFWRVLLLFAC